MSDWKVKAIRMIEEMPEDATLDQLAYRVSLWAKIARAEAELAAGKGIPHDQVMREMDEWLASFGPPEPASPSSGG